MTGDELLAAAERYFGYRTLSMAVVESERLLERV